MIENNRQREIARPRETATGSVLMRARWAIGGLLLGIFAGAWIGGGTDRYGEADGVLGGLRGACGTIARGYRYAAASIRACTTRDGSSVRNLGLERQIETRLWQDKRLDAEGIVVGVEDGGRVVLTGQVPDPGHKEMAMVLARDTRGVEIVVDQLAVGSDSRTIDTPASAAVATGVATGVRIKR